MSGKGAEPVQPLFEELTPAPDPWEVCRRLARLPRLLFLDSADTSPELSRYSFVTAAAVRLDDARQGVITDGESRMLAERPLRRTSATTAGRYRVEAIPGLPPFQGGAAGLLGYDLCHHIERLPRPRRDEFETPDLAVGFYEWVIAFDHAQRRAWIISTGLPEADAKKRRDRAAQRLIGVKRLLAENTAEFPSPAAREPRLKSSIPVPSFRFRPAWRG